MDRREQAEDQLRARFAPAWLTVEDESHLHRGHAGWREGEVTHLAVEMGSACFRDRSRIERHRMVHDALAALFADGLHALRLRLEAADAQGAEPGR